MGNPTSSSAADAPAPGEDRPSWARGTAKRLQSAPDAEKAHLLDALEGFVSVSGHDGWAAVYDNADVVGTLATVIQQSSDATVGQRLTDFLIKVYRDHFDDGGDSSENLKNLAAAGLVNVYGSEIFAVIDSLYNDDGLAQAISDRAEYVLHDDFIVAAKNTSTLEKMGINGAGETILVADDANSDHMAHTTYLADPERSGSGLIPYGCDSVTGHAFVENIHKALQCARENHAEIVSISAGLTWDDGDKDDYLQRCNGDEAQAAAMFGGDMAALQADIESFAGVVVVAAGNSGPGGPPNDLARSPDMLIADALDRPEQAKASFDSPAYHPENVIGVGTAVWAMGQDGQLHFIDDATSWAAPQIAHYVACVFQAGKQFDQSTNAGEVRTILKRTAQPVRDDMRADVCCAVRFAKTLAYLKSTGDGVLVQKLWGLPADKARQVADACEPLLHALGPDSKAKIGSIIDG